jgi:glycosyltransferase involved in cell wall biosynthesis
VKILITTNTFPPQKNGVAHVVEAHATGLMRLGHDVTVVTGTAPLSTDGTWNGVKVRRFDTRGDGRWIRGGYSGDIRGYQDYIAAFDGDIIICHCWQIWSTDLAVQVFDRVACPKMLVSHGVSAKVLQEYSLRGLVIRLGWIPYLANLRRMLAEFDHVVVLSDLVDSKSFYDHQLMHRLGYRQHTVIPNGVYAKSFNSAASRAEEFRTRYGIGKKPMVLYVSNFDGRKNQKSAVKVFLAAAVPDAMLVLIGSEMNDYARAAQGLAKNAGPRAQRIIFLEKQTVEDTVAAFCAADLFLCTSNWELQPLVLLEAMAAGKPFVCKNVGCVREFPGGIIVKNEREMVLALRTLMSDELLGPELGRRGLMSIHETYDWEKVVIQYDNLLHKIRLDWENQNIRA